MCSTEAGGKCPGLARGRAALPFANTPASCQHHNTGAQSRSQLCWPLWPSPSCPGHGRCAWQTLFAAHGWPCQMTPLHPYRLQRAGEGQARVLEQPQHLKQEQWGGKELHRPAGFSSIRIGKVSRCKPKPIACQPWMCSLPASPPASCAADCMEAALTCQACGAARTKTSQACHLQQPVMENPQVWRCAFQPT